MATDDAGKNGMLFDSFCFHILIVTENVNQLDKEM